MDSGFVPIPIICIFLLGKMRPLILRDISEQCLLIPIIFVVVIGSGGGGVCVLLVGCLCVYVSPF